ncbi:MAG: hypothetical protein K2V38_13645, partial [Gemmataceae bacterium]|nr:hypothetical protein [Gemmataceae bacterium]
VKAWSSKQPKIRENNPMLFLSADKDTTGKKQSEYFFNEVLVANPKKGSGLNPLEQTFLKEVKDGAELKGVALIGKGTPKTEDTIVSFLAAIQKERAKRTSQNRNFSSPYFVDLAAYGLKP